MAVPVLIIGQSGSGKTTSLRNLENAFVINVVGKPLPFKKKDTLITYKCDNYAKIKTAILQAVERDYKTIVIDDAGYLITKQFMDNHSTSGKGSSIFDLYNTIGDEFYKLFVFIAKEVPQDVVVYQTMHVDKNDFGETKPKTIGKMLDEKVCIEGLYTIVLYAMKNNGKYVFRTNSDGLDCSKSPMEMFDEIIDNDLNTVNKRIREYYELDEKGEQK